MLAAVSAAVDSPAAVETEAQKVFMIERALPAVVASHPLEKSVSGSVPFQAPAGVQLLTRQCRG